VKKIFYILLLLPLTVSAGHWHESNPVVNSLSSDCRAGAMALAGGMHSFSLNTKALQGSVAGATIGGCDALSGAVAMVINERILLQGSMCVSAGDSCFGFSAGMRF